MSIISVDSLTKVFQAKKKSPGLMGSIRSLVKPGFSQVEAVKSISFSVEAGEILAFIGPNGAGKSTTIKMLTGILHPTAGKAQVLGVTPWLERQKLAYQIGSVFGQKSQLWYHLPPIDSYRLLGSIYELDAKTSRERIAYLVEVFELADLLNTPVRKLSLGQRMRCEIAACLLHRPRVLFLDEPTIGLDVVAKLRIRALIKRINKEEGVTIFLTSHDPGDIEQLCKRVIIINHGELILDTSTSTLKHNYLNSKIVEIGLAEPAPDLAIAGIEVLKHTKKGIKFKVDTTQVTMEAVLRDLMLQARVGDINIQDPSMEEVIRDIYARPKARGVADGEAG